MGWSYFLLSLLFFQQSIWAQEAGWLPNQVNTTMCQWQEPRVGVIRDTAYIDGGYLYWLPGLADGTYGSTNADGNPLGLVYLLNFSIPFNITSNITQILTTVSKGGGGAANNLGQLYYDGAMFANDGEYYTYGGLVSKTDSFQAPDSQTVEGYEAYWYGAVGKQFTPGFITENLPQGMTRYVTAGGAVSVPSENIGFYFSGLRSASDGPIFYTSGNKSLNADVISNTLISVDLSTQRSEKWTNHTLPSSVPGRANPEIVWIPVSKQGALVALGGSVDPEFAYASQSLNASQMAQDQASNPGLMQTVSIYDVDAGTWYNQQTTGDAPGSLTQGCAVVASAQDGTSHNIYWYGGFDGVDATKPFSDDVFVLSVPAFVWTKVYSGTSTHGRAGHKCVKPYPDQMFVIGGYTAFTGTELTCVEGGLVQVFNLSSATWMAGYDPTSWSNYSVPATITKTIGGTGIGGATQIPTWSNQSLSKLFSATYDSTKIKNWYPYSVQPSVGSNPRQTAQPTPAAVSSGLPSWVAPVLGVVLGLVFITALVVCILLWRRRRYLKRNGSLAATSDVNRYRILSWVRGNEGKTPTVTSEETPSGQGYDEMESPGAGSPHALHAEAAGTQIYEMADTSQVQELSATGMQYLPTKNSLRPPLISSSPSQVSHVSHASVGSSISHLSKDSISSAGAVSPVLASSTPRADSPSLGGSDSRTRFLSGISATSSQYRDLAAVPDVGGGSSIPTVVEPQDEILRSPEDHGIVSPISPPIPQNKNGKDYLSSRPSPSSAGGNRKSNFGEILDE